MYQIPTKPLTIGEVLDRGFALFRASFSSVWYIALVGGLASVPYNLINFSSISTTGAATAPLLPPPAAIAAFIVYMFIALVLFNVNIARIGGIARGQPLPLGESIAVGLRRFPAMLGAGILFTLGVIVTMIFLIIPAVWFSVAFYFALFAPVLERRGPVDSMRYGFTLVKGRWWRTAGVLTVIFLILMVVYVLFAIVLGVAAAFSGGSPEEIIDQVMWVQIITAPLLQIVMIPLSYSMFLAVYEDSKLRYEGADLAERVAAATA
jgi:hypothetical protein